MFNQLKFLDIPKYPSIAPNVWIMQFTGLRNPKYLKSNVAKFKKIYFYTIVSLFLSQYVKSILKFDVSSLMLLLQYAPFHIGFAKICIFKKDYKKWEKIISYITAVEQKQLAEGDEEINKILNEYVNRARRISFCFWALPVLVDPLVFYEPFMKNQSPDNSTDGTYLKVLDYYLPHTDYPPGYYVSMFIQTITGFTMSAYIVSWDTFVCVTMIFFAAQLKITRLVCTRMIVAQNNKETQKNIAECHSFYTTLVKNQRLFNTLVSPVMFVNLFVTSINFGISIIEIARVNNDLGTLASGCAYLVACLIQLLIFYWHSNEVTEQSLLVSYGTFESDWTRVHNKYQKQAALLGVTTAKRLVFEAGPFNEMTLKTFLGIIRASYSFYTLLNKTN